MSELSRIDSNLVDLFAASRRAAEQEIIDRASIIHEQSRVESLALGIGRVLMEEFQATQSVLLNREKYMLSGYSYNGYSFQPAKGRMARKARELYDSSPSPTGVEYRINGVRNPKYEYLIRVDNAYDSDRHKRYGPRLLTDDLFPQEAEFTDKGIVRQAWRIRFDNLYEARIMHIARDTEWSLGTATPLANVYLVPKEDEGHRIPQHSDTPEFARVWKVKDDYLEAAEDADYYFALGLFMEATKRARDDIPKKILKKW